MLQPLCVWFRAKWFVWLSWKFLKSLVAFGHHVIYQPLEQPQLNPGVGGRSKALEAKIWLIYIHKHRNISIRYVAFALDSKWCLPMQRCTIALVSKVPQCCLLPLLWFRTCALILRCTIWCHCFGFEMAAEYWDFSFSKWCSNAKKRFEWFQSGAVERHFENEINDESCVLEFGHHFEIKATATNRAPLHWENTSRPKQRQTNPTSSNWRTASKPKQRQQIVNNNTSKPKQWNKSYILALRHHFETKATATNRTS